MDIIRATIVYSFIGIYVLVLAPIALGWTIITGNDALIYSLSRFCIRVSGWICGIRVVIEGKEKIQPGQAYLFLSNHQANVDGPVLFHSIPRNWKALIKKELMHIPVLSLVMKKIHFVPVDRLDPVRARESIGLAVKLLAGGHSFVAFPEGTRSRDGRLGTFKKGVFIMAIEAHMPVIPISIVNSSKVQPPGTYAIHPGTIRVVIHDPISTDPMSAQDRNRLIEVTQAAISSGLSRQDF